MYALQVRLKALGYLRSQPDGVYGPATVEAVIAWQRDRGLLADGVVTEEAWDALAKGVVPPEGSTVASAQQRPSGQLSIVVDTDRRRLTLLADGKPYKSYPVAVGRADYYLSTTPIGEWQIIQKDKDWGDGFGTRWLGLDVPWGIYGIHGTNKPWLIGDAVSGGCIRMFNQHVEELWEWVKVGTPVTIIGRPYHLDEWPALRVKSAGPQVVLVQLTLKQWGLYTGRANGRYGEETAAAVRLVQQLFALPADGEVDQDVYEILGLGSR